MKHFPEDEAREMAKRALIVVRNTCGDDIVGIYTMRRGGLPVSLIADMLNISEADVEAALAAADKALVDDDMARNAKPDADAA